MVDNGDNENFYSYFVQEFEIDPILIRIRNKDFDIKNSLLKKEEIDRKMLCSKCNKLMNFPYLTDCEHYYCGLCKNDIYKCPIDGENITNWLLIKSLKKKIEDISLNCPINSNCNWTGELIQLESHLLECGYQQLLCQNGCKELIFKKDMISHIQNMCKGKFVKCQYCNMDIEEKNIINHFDRYCKKAIIKCYNDCDEDNLTRENIEEHLLFCPNRSMPCCVCKELIPIKKLNEHILENIGDHFFYLIKEKERLNQELNNYKKEIDKIKEDNYHLQQSLAEFESDHIKIQEKKLSESQYKFLNRIDYSLNSKELSIYGKKFDKEILTELRIGLKHNKNISLLWFEKNNLGDNLEYVKDIMSSVINCKNLDTISLWNEKLGNNPQNIDIIMKGLIQLPNLQWIRLGNNQFGNDRENMKILMKGLKGVKNLKRLGLYDNNLGADIENIKEIADFLKENKTLKTLGISKNNLGLNYEENLRLLADAINTNKVLDCLNISENNFNKYTEAFRLLAEADSLQSIDLEGNDFSEADREQFKRLNSIKKTKIFKY